MASERFARYAAVVDFILVLLLLLNMPQMRSVLMILSVFFATISCTVQYIAVPIICCQGK